MTLYRDLILLILQFFEERKLIRTARILEQETGVFFSLDHLEELVLNRQWDEAEHYISDFVKPEDTPITMSIFFKIRRQKYLNALAEQDYTTAMNILHKELQAMPRIDSSWNELHEQLAQLLAYTDFSKSEYRNVIFGERTMSARKRVVEELKEAIKKCQLPTSFPQINRSRLKCLINQSLSWQHSLCEHPRAQLAIGTLFLDHVCLPRDGMDDELVGGSSSFIQAFDEDENFEASVTVKSRKQKIYSELIASENDNKKIQELAYTNYGGVINGILSLWEDGILVLWRWANNDTNLTGEATTKCAPRLVTKLTDGPASMNDVPCPVRYCFAVSQDECYVISASGLIIVLYKLWKQLERVQDFRLQLNWDAAITCVLFNPPNNDVVFCGTDEGTIAIYDTSCDQMDLLEGHSGKITGMAFSSNFNTLISCAVDNEIVVWDNLGLNEKRSVMLNVSSGWSASEESEMSLRLDKDGTHFLAVHESQLSIYEIETLECVRQYAVGRFCARVRHAAFSCDGELVYALMNDGKVMILEASSLTPKSWINPSAYLPSPHSSVRPVVVAVHPVKRDQFALGLSNGEVAIVENEGTFLGNKESHSPSTL